MQKEKLENTVLIGHKNELSQKIVTEEDIRRALKQNEFMLYYQPQINSRSGRLVGMEALLRWEDPEKGFIQRRFGKYDNVVVVPNGIDRPATPAADEKPYIDGKYLLMLGRVCKWKGVSRLLDIYMSKLSDSGLKLVIAGEATEQTVKEHVLKCCRENPNIIWLDYVSDALKSNLYKNAAVLCYPSVYDGFGLPPLEAACYGTKCLMNDIPVLREGTKGKGYYVDYYGDGKAADAILRVIDDDNTVTEAVKRVAMSYSWHNWAEKVYSLLRK